MIITATDFFSRSPADLPPSVEDAFFSAIRNRNNTFKRTHRARFVEIDAAFADAMAGRACAPTEVLDVGISSGTTTLDLQEALGHAALNPRITATDLALDARLVRLNWSCSALVSPECHLLQLAFGPLSVRPWRRRLDWFNGMWLARPLLTRWANRRLKHASLSKAVQLVSPRVRAHPSIDVVEDDVLIRRPAFQARFDAIRAANVLNRDYFSAGELRTALSNLQSYLRGPGALLLILRSLNDGSHHGTLWELGTGGRLAVVRRFGQGSEIEELLLES